MATNLQIDDRLLHRAQRLGRHKTKRETVNEALAEYVRRREQLKLKHLYGTIDFDPGYDYKAQRNRR
jgi:Arc/MetJ family transcription regulator